jgi:hypothetical protein
VLVLRRGRVVLDGSPGEVFAEPNWRTLASTFLEPTAAARVGARLNLGSTPTVGEIVAALQDRVRQAPA